MTSSKNIMTTPIKQLVDDADFLVAGKRYTGALLVLLVAVAASSKKMFPEGTSSIDDPAVKPGQFKKMGDEERFVRFLGPRIQKILFNDPFMQEDGRHQKLMRFSDGPNPEEVIYEKYRCALLHEGKLSNEIVFSPEKDASDSIGITMQGEVVTFTSNLLQLLRLAVVEAPINGKEFGIVHCRLTPKFHPTLNGLVQELANEFQTSNGRINVMLSILQLMGPIPEDLSDEELNAMFIRAGGLGPSASGLQSKHLGKPLCNASIGLTEHGVTAVKRAIELLDFVDVSG